MDKIKNIMQDTSVQSTLPSFRRLTNPASHPKKPDDSDDVVAAQSAEDTQVNTHSTNQHQHQHQQQSTTSTGSGGAAAAGAQQEIPDDIMVEGGRVMAEADNNFPGTNPHPTHSALGTKGGQGGLSMPGRE